MLVPLALNHSTASYLLSPTRVRPSCKARSCRNRWSRAALDRHAVVFQLPVVRVGHRADDAGIGRIGHHALVERDDHVVQRIEHWLGVVELSKMVPSGKAKSTASGPVDRVLSSARRYTIWSELGVYSVLTITKSPS